jgi:hypothetical protein
MPLEETVTVTRPVPVHIADLVLFARTLQGKEVGKMKDAEMVALAREFWDRQHGED